MRIWGLLILAGLFTGCSQPPSPAPTSTPKAATATPQTSFSSADEAVLAVYQQMGKGNFPEGVRLGEIGLRSYPDSFQLLTNYGACLLQVQRFEDASTTFERARKVAPPESEWTIALQQARAASQMNRLAKAEEHFAQATELLKKDQAPDENFVEQLYRMRASNLVDDARPKESVPFFSKAMEYKKPNVRALAGRALAYSESGDEKNYKVDMEALRKLNPGLADAMEADRKSVGFKPGDELREGVELLRAGRSEEALASLDKAIKKDPNSAAAFRFKGSALQSLQRSPEAIEAYSKSYALDKNEVALYNRAMCLVKIGEMDKAEKDFKEFLLISKSPDEKKKAQEILDMLAQAKDEGGK